MEHTFSTIIPMTTTRKMIKKEDIVDITISCKENIKGNQVELLFSKKEKVCSAYLKVNNLYKYIEESSKNKNATVRKLYESFKKLEFVEEQKITDENRKEIFLQQVEDIYKECEEEFRELLGENINVDVDGFQKITEGELKRYISRILESDPEELNNLRTLNKKIKEYEKNIFTQEEIPQDLLELAVKAKGTIPKLEKVLVIKARRLVLTHKIHHKKESYVDEFFKRFFDPEDVELAKKNGVEDNKNFMRLARIETSKVNTGHSGYLRYNDILQRKEYVATKPGLLEIKLGIEYEDLMGMVYQEMIENVYMFDPQLDTKLDTYVFQTIKNALQKIRNLTLKKDSKGATREQGWKETKVVAKLQKLRNILEERNQEYTVDNVLEEMEREPEKYKDLTEKDVKSFFNFSTDNYIDFESVWQGGEDDYNNEVLLYSLWEEKQKNTEVDPEGHFIKQETNELLEKALKKLVSTDAEKLVLEFLLEKLVEDQGNLKIEAKEFNHFYEGKLKFEAMKQKEIDEILEKLLLKISNQRNEFRLLTGIDF